MRAPFFTEPSLRARSLALVVVACLGLVAGAAATQAASAPQSGEQPAVREALGGPTQYWFAPQPPRGPQVGAQDFMSLFDRRAKWAKSSQRLDTFKLYQFWVQGATDQQLSVIIKELKRRGLRIALETPPLSSAEGCGQGVEGFDPNPITATRDTVQRLKLLGGTVSVIAFSEPLSFATNVYTGPNACNWSVDQVADRVAAYLTGVLAVHPGLTYGDIESDHADVGLVEQFLAAMRARGKPMSFLHWDVDWETEVHWVEDSAHMAQRARAHGARFGMLYYGRPSDPTSASWLNSARQHAAMFETLTNVRPDDVLFQSFHALPLYTLPEANAAAMTNLVLRYFLRRTSITLNPLQADGASLPVSGALRRTPGGILPNRPVQVVARALDGPGFVHEFRIDSVVPANASEALIGIRVNTECSCAG
ncbi:MAG: hypothetical protein ACKVVT_02855, partial [Dehalococcoidia bacterium]